MLAPSVDDDLRFAARAEPFDAQAFVAQLAVETLGTVLPRFAGIDQRHLDVRLDDPPEDRLADELRAVIGAQEPRGAALAHEHCEHINDALGADAAGDVDREALARVLVDDRLALDLLAVGAGIEDEVVCPDAVRREGRQRTWT